MYRGEPRTKGPRDKFAPIPAARKLWNSTVIGQRNLHDKLRGH